MGVQTRVGRNLATGIVGNFATSNPRHSLVAGVFQHRVGEAGVLIGGFAEVDATTGLTVQPLTGKNPIGFVGRESNQALTSSLQLVQGQGVSLYDGGDFFVKLDTATAYGDVIKCDTTGKITADGTIETPFKVAVPTDESGLTVITRA